MKATGYVREEIRFSPMVGAGLGVMLLLGFGFFKALLLGAMTMYVLRKLPIKPAVGDWIAGHRWLLTGGALLVGALCWPTGEDEVQRACRCALPMFVIVSLLGASQRGAPSRNVGPWLGLLIAGAFGGPIRAGIGLVLGAVVGWFLRNRSGRGAGAAVGVTLAALLMTPSLEGYGFDLITSHYSLAELRRMAVEEAEEAARNGDEWAHADQYFDPSDQTQHSFLGFLVAWMAGVVLGALWGMILGNFAKGPRSFADSTLPPVAEAATSNMPDEPSAGSV